MITQQTTEKSTLTCDTCKRAIDITGELKISYYKKLLTELPKGWIEFEGKHLCSKKCLEGVVKVIAEKKYQVMLDDWKEKERKEKEERDRPKAVKKAEENPNLKLPKEERLKKVLFCFKELNEYLISGGSDVGWDYRNKAYSYCKDYDEWLEFLKSMPYQAVKDIMIISTSHWRPGYGDKIFSPKLKPTAISNLPRRV